MKEEEEKRGYLVFGSRGRGRGGYEGIIFWGIGIRFLLGFWIGNRNWELETGNWRKKGREEGREGGEERGRSGF